MLIVDSNVIIKWFVDEPLHAEARHIFKYRQDLAAPEFALIEVANVVWKKVIRNEITPKQAGEIIALSKETIPELIYSPDFLEQAYRLAVELNHPVYDSLYLACAGDSESTLVTGDKRFFDKVTDTRLSEKIKFLNDPDLQLPLYIPLHEINELIKLSDRDEETHKYLISNLRDEDELSSINMSEMQPYFDSPTYRRLIEKIGSLSVDEQSDVLALGWFGRGYEDSDWREIRERAEMMIRGSDQRFLIYVSNLVNYLEAGLAALRDQP